MRNRASWTKANEQHTGARARDAWAKKEVPLEDGSFDVAVSEYGASIWCDPGKWIPEAARLLRPGGEVVFLRNSTLARAQALT